MQPPAPSPEPAPVAPATSGMNVPAQRQKTNAAPVTAVPQPSLANDTDTNTRHALREGGPAGLAKTPRRGTDPSGSAASTQATTAVVAASRHPAEAKTEDDKHAPGPGRTRRAKTEPEESPSGDAAASAAIAKAEAAFSGGHMASARISATQAVVEARSASDVLKVRAQIIMGKVELASERFAEADRAFERALAIDPNNPVARKGKERALEAAKARKP